MNDGELLQRYLRDRSEEAFAELVRRHLDVVFSAACRQTGGDVHQAQDIAQSVFADLARKAPLLTHHTALVGWLYTSTHYAALRWRRDERRRKAREKEASIMQHLLKTTPDDAANWDRLQPVLDAAMHELSARDRQAVLLRFFQQQSFAEVGRHLGVGESGARMAVERAVDKLGGLLARRGVTSSLAALAVALGSQTVMAAPTGVAATITSGALAPAVTGGVAAGIFQLMAKTKLGWGIAAAAGVLMCALIGYEARVSRRTAEQIAAVERETTMWRGRGRENEARQAAQAVVAARVEPAAAEAAKPEEAPSIGEQVSTALARDPELIRLRAHRDRLGLTPRFMTFYEEMGWGAEQIARFEALFETAAIEDFEAQAKAKVKETDLLVTEEAKTARAAARANFEDHLREEFGPAAIEKYHRAEWGEEARKIAAEVAGQVYLTGTPLTREQSETLVNLIETHSPQYQNGSAVVRKDVNWEKLLTQTQAVLTPAQQTALQSLQARFFANNRRLEVLTGGTQP